MAENTHLVNLLIPLYSNETNLRELERIEVQGRLYLRARRLKEI